MDAGSTKIKLLPDVEKRPPDSLWWDERAKLFAELPDHLAVHKDCADNMDDMSLYTHFSGVYCYHFRRCPFSRRIVRIRARFYHKAGAGTCFAPLNTTPSLLPLVNLIIPFERGV